MMNLLMEEKRLWPDIIDQNCYFKCQQGQKDSLQVYDCNVFEFARTSTNKV
jgi:hypothetical protein